jgi:hypothetical protein
VDGQGKRPGMSLARGARAMRDPAWVTTRGWTFTHTDGVEPTNNHAERGLRAPSSTADSHSAANPNAANAPSNDSSPPPSPAGSANSRSTPTSPKPSPPTPAATQYPHSPDPQGLNAYAHFMICRIFRLLNGCRNRAHSAPSRRRDPFASNQRSSSRTLTSFLRPRRTQRNSQAMCSRKKSCDTRGLRGPPSR